MEMKPLGSSGITVSRLGLGCATFGREIDEATSFGIMDAALERGITLFDTAEAYGGGQARQHRRDRMGVEDVREVSGEMHSSEKILGRWIKSRGVRSQVTIQTKVSANRNEQETWKALEASLRRLQTDTIDLYLFHNYDPEVPLEEGLAALDRGEKAGRIRCSGCSNFSAGQLSEALGLSGGNGLSRLRVIQPNYNLVHREIETELLPLCQRQGVGVVTYSPLGAGFLAGKYTADQATIPKGTRFDVIPGHVDVYFHPSSFRIVEQLRRMASRTGLSMVQLAMGWVLNREGVDSVLIGARKTGHLDNAFQAMEMDFPSEWMAEMNAWS